MGAVLAALPPACFWRGGSVTTTSPGGEGPGWGGRWAQPTWAGRPPLALCAFFSFLLYFFL